VFVGRTGNPIITVQKVSGIAASNAGLTDLHFHDLRHTFASHLVMNGVGLTTVKEFLGHKSIQMTLRYAHLSQPHKRKAVENLAELTDGHFLDTKAQKVANAHFGDVR
jgi:integrase